MAPGANILLVEGNPNFGDITNGILAINAAASSMHIGVLSMNFNSSEGSNFDYAFQEEEYEAYLFDTPGIVYVASTGDYGAYSETYTTTISPQFPASSSNVLAVGGTTLNISGGVYAGETTWGNGTSSGAENGGGGGISLYEPQPAYQVGKVNGLSTSARIYPDISLNANSNSGVAYYDSPDYGTGTGWVPGIGGGTEISASLMAGIVAIADQGRAINGLSLLASSGGAGVAASNPNGNASSLDIHTLLYGFTHSDFNDITTGSSIGPSSYGPLTGYDLSTGLGSPNGSHLIADLAASTVTAVSLAGAQYYFQLDSDGVHLDIWAGNSPSGTLYDSVLASQLTSLVVNGSGASPNLTIDFTNGNPIPNGATFNGSGPASSNQLSIIGSASSSDTVVSSTGQVSIDGSIITDSAVGMTTFTPGTGTDILVVNSGTLQLARRSGFGVLPELFSIIAINGTSKLTVAAPTAHATRVLVDASTLTIAGSTNAWTGTLDLSGNDLAVTGGSLTTVSNQVATGYAAGLWNGAGIQSSMAASSTNHLTALGTILNSAPGASLLYGTGTALGTFDLASPGAAAILVKYTYYGDSNLDGKVDGSDYTRIDAGNNGHGSQTGWFNGDLNYDNNIDGSDYTLIDNAFNTQGAHLAALVATPSATHTAPVFSTQPMTTTTLFSNITTIHKRRRPIDDIGLE